jgi:probable rRNA maturation factor
MEQNRFPRRVVTFQIEVQNDAEYPLDEARLVQAAETVLSQHVAQHDLALTVVVTSDDTVAEMNRQYRNVEGPTDVLSFPAAAPPVELEGEPRYLGDLVIAYPYASAQAEREGHALNDSLALLVVHGTLHLLGYDHDTQEQREQMWAVQAQALTALKIPLEMVPALESGSHGKTELD